MNSRLKQFASRLPFNRLDGFLVTRDANIRYLTHYNASESWLFITARKAFYITDSRYELEAKQGLKGVTVKLYQKSIIDTLFGLAGDMRVKTIGFDPQHISLAGFQKIKKSCPKRIKMMQKINLIEKEREIKDKEELARIRRCIRLNLKAITFLKRTVKPGLTEREVLNKLEDFVKSHRAGFSFSPIIASGVHSCFPHAQVTDRKITKNDVVLIDMGIDIDGYKSDLTRMFFLGKIPPLVREVNRLVDESQKEAIKIIKPGISASDVDKAARQYLQKHELAKYFGHSLGHGVGLDIHEAPWIAKSSKSILKEEMIFTVEPAVYIPSKFGIRIEDMVRVTAKGCEVLTR